MSQLTISPFSMKTHPFDASLFQPYADKRYNDPLNVHAMPYKYLYWTTFIFIISAVQKRITDQQIKHFFMPSTSPYIYNNSRFFFTLSCMKQTLYADAV